MEVEAVSMEIVSLDPLIKSYLTKCLNVIIITITFYIIWLYCFQDNWGFLIFHLWFSAVITVGQFWEIFHLN